MIKEVFSKTKKVKKSLQEYSQSKPLQLELFKLNDDNDGYSNTIELYDQMPKYYLGGVKRVKSSTVDALPILQRNFKHRGTEYELRISPAALIDKKTGKTIHHLPSQREELVEDVIRKLAIQKDRGIFLDDDSGVKFSLYEIQNELIKINHGYSIHDIKEAIDICNKSIIEITSKEGSAIEIASTIFPFVAKETSEEIKSGKNRYVVMFHPLVTRSINRKTYRLINYDKLMSHKMPLSRWLHKRISHNFIQASSTNPYNIKLSTIIRDSGMKEYQKISHSILQICKSLDELKKAEVIDRYDVSKEKEGRKIINAIFLLYVSNSFVKDIKKANKIANLEFEQISDSSLEEINERISQDIFGLSTTIINNILLKIRTKRDKKIIIDALQSAEEYILKNNNCNPPAITKTALKEGWKPRAKKQESTESFLPNIIDSKQENKDVLKTQIMELECQQWWKDVIKDLKLESEKVVFNKWLSNLRPYSKTKDHLKICVKSKFLRDWIKREYLDKSDWSKNKKNISDIILKRIPNIEKISIIYCEV